MMLKIHIGLGVAILILAIIVVKQYVDLKELKEKES